MSFTTNVKAEIGQIELTKEEQRVELAALIQILATLNFTKKGANLTLQIENANTAKRIWEFIKNCYGIDSQLSVIKKVKLKKNNIYVIRVESAALLILRDLEIFGEEGLRKHPTKHFTQKEKFAKAYIRGAFLASGSVNSPKKTDYHLEISLNSMELAEYIQSLLVKYDLQMKIVKRRTNEVAYMKSSEKIGDFLRFIGASQAVFVFEDQRIQRSFLNSLTRIDNCEVANEMKVMKAAQRQLDDIEWIESYQNLDGLSETLRKAAILRKENPDASLSELCELYELQYNEPISKSGMKHRFTKLKTIASQYRGHKP